MQKSWWKKNGSFFEAEEMDAEDPLFYSLYTSGSTWKTKRVVHTLQVKGFAMHILVNTFQYKTW